MTCSRLRRFLTFTAENLSKHLEALWFVSMSGPSPVPNHADILTLCVLFFFLSFSLSSSLIGSLISVYAKWSDAQRPCSGSNCPLCVRCRERFAAWGATQPNEADLGDFLPAWGRETAESLLFVARSWVVLSLCHSGYWSLTASLFIPPDQQVSSWQSGTTSSIIWSNITTSQPQRDVYFVTFMSHFRTFLCLRFSVAALQQNLNSIFSQRRK